MLIEEVIKKAFDKYYEAPLEAWKYFVDLCEKVEYGKKEYIKQAHKKEKYGYFLIKGAVGLFVWKNDKYLLRSFHGKQFL
jgi:hypothetical protein